MLAIFRKYQRILYIFITIIIVISFSFFGTYSTMDQNRIVDKVAFTAIDGTEFTRSELEAMVYFIATDSEDMLFYGGSWGPNFLNDGVIKRDILETGLAQPLVTPYLDNLKQDLQIRHQKEKHFTPYTHPQATFLSATNAWNIVAPDINTHLATHKALKDPTTPEAFDTRVNLYLAERKFPAPALKMLLDYQLKQFDWVRPDPNFAWNQLPLFGYLTVEDWFGPRFLRLTAEFIINSAIIAEQKGYQVSKSEALADLYHNAELSFQQVGHSPRLGVGSTQQYFNEHLRRYHLDQTKAIELWQKVMLFRRLFQDLGNSVFVDLESIQQFYDYAKEGGRGELYQLPEHLRLGDFRTLQKFEVYLDAVSARPESGNELLALPTEFLSVDEIAEKAPELTQRRYHLDIAKLAKKTLHAKVGVKETWQWEVQDKSWELLKEKFPELGIKKAETDQQRFAALDELDRRTRARVDAFAREQIVEQNPQWLEKALKVAPSEKKVVHLRLKGVSPDFGELKDPKVLIQLLDTYPKSQKELAHYSPDGQNYYRITVIEAVSDLEVLTYAEAEKARVLDALLDRKLDDHYQAIREGRENEFQASEGAWKPLYQVRDKVAADLFANLLDQIQQSQGSKELINDYAATVRLHAHMKELRNTFKNDPKAESAWIREVRPQDEQVLAPREPLANQWQIEKLPYSFTRSTEQTLFDQNAVLALKEGEWSEVAHRANGEVAFLYLNEKGASGDPVGLQEKVMEMHQYLADDAQKMLMKDLLSEMVAKKAISLDFLQQEWEE